MLIPVFIPQEAPGSVPNAGLPVISSAPTSSASSAARIVSMSIFPIRPDAPATAIRNDSFMNNSLRSRD